MPAVGRNPGHTLTAEKCLPHPAFEHLRSFSHRCRCRISLCWHADPGWYTEDPGELDEVNATWANFSAWARAHFPTKPFLISETGGGAIFEWHNTSGAAGRAESYVLRHGALAAGGDLGPPRNCTWEAAVAHCNRTVGCRGFTFRADSAAGGVQPTTAVEVYFKRRIGANSDARWASWVHASHLPPPKWSQEYQALLVGADVRAALSLPHVSGISIWQFSDIKADGTCFRASCTHETPPARISPPIPHASGSLASSSPVNLEPTRHIPSFALAPPSPCARLGMCAGRRRHQGVRQLYLRRTIQRIDTERLRVHHSPVLASRRRES